MLSRSQIRRAQPSNFHDAPRCDAGPVTYADDPDDNRRKLEAKLEPQRIRSTLAFAGLFQLTHELLKRRVLEDVKAFFGYSDLFGDGVWLLGPSGEESYRASVLSLSPKKPFEASLLWLQDMGAINADQVGRLDEIYAHRHDLTHELAKYLVDLDFEPDITLFVDAVDVLKTLSRFWVQVEIDVGAFEEHADITVDDVTPMDIATLEMCIRAYAEGLEG